LLRYAIAFYATVYVNVTVWQLWVGSNTISENISSGVCFLIRMTHAISQRGLQRHRIE